MRNILITGGAGFIGSHLTRHFVKKYPDYHIVNLDKLTYAGNLTNLKDIEEADNYTFVKGDICDRLLLQSLFDKYKFSGVIHTAAESHVDRSILNPMEFIHTNLVGTAQLLQMARESWSGNFTDKVFYHISTDEVYGSLEMNDELFHETTPYDPRSPYSASKAGSDHLVRAFYHTYGFPIKISNCSNNYGPYQFPEKLIPLFIHNIVENKDLPIYGKGENVRDWLYVEDHVEAIDLIFHEGRIGETYNIGGLNEWQNITLVKALISEVDSQLGREQGSSESLMKFVTDRAGHDLRYAIDCSKIEAELGWKPRYQFEEGLRETVKWYLENKEWVESAMTGEYREYYRDS